MTFEEARAAFPVLERFAYLNTGSVGPLSRATVDAMRAYLSLDLEDGRAGKRFFDDILELRSQVRERVAGIIGVGAVQLALTSSTSNGCAIVILGLRLGPEDEVVTTDVEHFGLLGPAYASGARVRVANLLGRPASEALDAILAEVTERTRLVALSHVSWTTGQVLPLAELRDAVAVPILVDGAQSVGAISVDAEPFDFYTVSGQKWLCGPDATGALYVREPERLQVAAPTYFAQESYEADGSFAPKEGAARFDSGWISRGSLAGLLAAMDGTPEWRFERAAAAAARCRELLGPVADVVTEPGQATLISFKVDGDPEERAAHAYEQGVVIRDMPGTGWLRASCGYWTSDDDLARLIGALDQ
jgi:L-cysteine/cystine lyase